MNEQRLKDMISGEISSINDVINTKRKDIEKTNLDIKYYEGQKDILVFVLETINKYKDEK